MRHIGSIALCVMIGPVVYLLVGVGMVKTAEALGSPDTDVRALAIGLPAMILAGLLYALLVMARLSPLGPVLVGLGFLLVTGLVVIDRARFADIVPDDVLGAQAATLAPAGAVSTLLAVPLLVTVISSRRWRRWANPPAAVPGTSYQPPPGGATTTYAGAPYHEGPPAGYPGAYAPPPATSGPPAATSFNTGEETLKLPTGGPGDWPDPYDPESTHRLNS